jgi:hypothetical protein
MEFDASVQPAASDGGIRCDRAILPIADRCQFLSRDTLLDQDADNRFGPKLGEFAIAQRSAEIVGVTADLDCHVCAAAGDFCNLPEFGDAFVR